MVALLDFIMATVWRQFLAEKKTVGRKRVHLTVTFSIIRLDMSHDRTDARYKTFIQCNCISFS